MEKLGFRKLVAAMALAAAPAMAADTTGSDALPGSYYQLNIVDSKIWLTPGADFKVCDGNGSDLGYGCPGSDFDSIWNTAYTYQDSELVELVTEKRGAVFQLPCNTNLSGYWDSKGQDAAAGMISCNQTVDSQTGEIVPVK